MNERNLSAAGRGIKIRVNGSTIRVETDDVTIEMPENRITNLKTFTNTRHCTIELEKIVLKMRFDNNKFRFYIKIKD